MEIIKTMGLKHLFQRRNESGEVTAETAALKCIDVEIERGSFVAIVGHNGSGKTTLARHFNALLLPTEGTVWIDGRESANPDNILAIRKSAGMVFQNPDNQLVASVVEEDIAFGPENIGVPTEEIWERVAQSLEKTGMSAYREMSPNRLSGGQKQRIAIAGILAMKPACMILDEPTAMLDPAGRKSVLDAVLALNRQERVTVILITHDMEEAALADRMIVMDHGEIVADGKPQEGLTNIPLLQELKLRAPFSAELAWSLRKAGMPIPEKVWNEEELVSAVSALLPLQRAAESETAAGQTAEESSAAALLCLEHVDFVYSKGLSFEKQALSDISLTIREGERVILIGSTGSGKSTLLEILAGLAKPSSGKVYHGGNDIYENKHSRLQICRMTGLVFQYPEYQLFGESVLEDVMFGPRNLGLSAEEARERAVQALQLMGIGAESFSKSPFALSGGEKRRVAIAGVLAMRPRVLLLDEPAAGLDSAGRKELAITLDMLAGQEAITILQTSHSMEEAAEFARRIIVLHNGKIISDGPTREVFRQTQNLEQIGLAAPHSLYFMRRLHDQGISVRTDVLTLQEAQEEILRLWKEAGHVS